MMKAAGRLRSLELAASRGQLATEEEVKPVYELVGLHAGRLVTCVVAEVGPLRDILLGTARHRWQFRRHADDRRMAESIRRAFESEGHDPEET
jgi:hypothetical protein